MMIIGNLLILIFAAMLTAFLIDRDIEDVLPPVTFAMLLMLYAAAILGKSHHSYQGMMIVFAAVWLFYIVRTKRLIPKARDIGRKLITPAFGLYILVLLLTYIIYANHIVTVWDDFHYNATLPKDMFYYGTLPAGSKSATFYRSYLPLMQLFFYWGFQGIRDFSEHLMFFYKMFLIYTCMLPLFKKINKGSILKRMVVGVIAVIMPYCFMYELFESLSMDTFMAGMFSYALINIIFEADKDIFSYIKIALSLCCLTLVKQISPIFTAVSLGSWLIVIIADYLVNKRPQSSVEQLVKTSDGSSLDNCNSDDIKGADGKGRLRLSLIAWLVTSVLCGLSYLSWKIYCNIKGNTVYLSGKLQDSVGGGLFRLPDYGRKTISDFAKSIFAYHMNLSANGLSLICVVLIALVITLVIVLYYKNHKPELAGMIVVLLGLLGYLLVLCYTYVFVFEQWEAESLSSIDRYFGTYAFALTYVFLYGLICCGENGREAIGADNGKNNRDMSLIVSALLAVILLATFPWDSIYLTLIPANYFATHINQMLIMNEAGEEAEIIRPHDREVGTILVVTDEGNTLYSRGLTYNLIPLVPSELIIEDASSNRAAELIDKCKDEGVNYVYFNNEFLDAYPNADKIVEGAVDIAGSLPKGQLYSYDRERELIIPITD